MPHQRCYPHASILPVSRVLLSRKTKPSLTPKAAEAVVDGSLLGVRVGAGSLRDLVSAARTSIANRREPFVFACANPHSLVVARNDPEFRRALEGWGRSRKAVEASPSPNPAQTPVPPSTPTPSTPRTGSMSLGWILVGLMLLAGLAALLSR